MSLTDTQLDPQEMKEKLALQENLMTQKDKALQEARASLDNIEEEMKAWKLQHRDTHKKLRHEQATNSIMKTQLSSLQSELDECREKEREFQEMKERVFILEGVEKVLNESKEEVEDFMMAQESPTTLATFAVALKRDYQVLKENKTSLLKAKDRLSEEVSWVKKQLKSTEKELRIYREQLSVMESDLHTAEEEKKTMQKKVEMLQAAINSPGSRHALKRMLESPLPDHLPAAKKPAELGASPMLCQNHAPSRSTHTGDVPKETKFLGIKRPHISKENIVMPVSKVPKIRQPMQPKLLSSHVIKKGLKFAPRKPLKHN